MKQCSQCGTEISDNVTVCASCAHGVADEAKQKDGPAEGLAILCFFIPIVGLILYLVWNDQRPLKAASCGKAALYGLIFVILAWMLYVKHVNSQMKALTKSINQEISRQSQQFQRQADQEFQRLMREAQRDVERQLRSY